MFTGIVEQCGKIITAEKTDRGIRFSIKFNDENDPVRPGESIAVNGVCLTVASCCSDSFTVEAVKETLAATTLIFAGPGHTLNLERSLRVGDRMGGHVVTGHVDGVGTIARVTRGSDSHRLVITYPPPCKFYLKEKGSVAVDGVSLTIQSMVDDSFVVAIVPHTAKVTTFGDLKEGDSVNVEVDILARYAQHDPKLKNEFPFTAESLRAQGF